MKDNSALLQGGFICVALAIISISADSSIFNKVIAEIWESGNKKVQQGNKYRL